MPSVFEIHLLFVCWFGCDSMVPWFYGSFDSIVLLIQSSVIMFECRWKERRRRDSPILHKTFSIQVLTFRVQVKSIKHATSIQTRKKEKNNDWQQNETEGTFRLVCPLLSSVRQVAKLYASFDLCVFESILFGCFS